jgi:hypothetical protein
VCEVRLAPIPVHHIINFTIFNFIDLIILNIIMLVMIFQGSRGQRPLAFWNCRFESLQGHRRLSLVSVAGCQVNVSVLGMITRPEESYRMWSAWCDSEASIMRRLLSTKSRCAIIKTMLVVTYIESNSVIPSWTGLNILCRNKRVLLQYLTL